MQKLNYIILFFCLTLSTFVQAEPAKSIQEVIDESGQPDEVIHHLNGMTEYIYIKKYRSPMYAPSSTQPQAIIVGKLAIGIHLPQQEVGSTTLVLCVTTYEVNSKGIIVKVGQEGNRCTEQGER